MKMIMIKKIFVMIFVMFLLSLSGTSKPVASLKDAEEKAVEYSFPCLNSWNSRGTDPSAGIRINEACLLSVLAKLDRNSIPMQLLPSDGTGVLPFKDKHKAVHHSLLHLYCWKPNRGTDPSAGIKVNEAYILSMYRKFHCHAFFGSIRNTFTGFRFSKPMLENLKRNPMHLQLLPFNGTGVTPLKDGNKYFSHSLLHLSCWKPNRGTDPCGELQRGITGNKANFVQMNFSLSTLYWLLGNSFTGLPILKPMLPKSNITSPSVHLLPFYETTGMPLKEISSAIDYYAAHPRCWKSHGESGEIWSGNTAIEEFVVSIKFSHSSLYGSVGNSFSGAHFLKHKEENLKNHTHMLCLPFSDARGNQDHNTLFIASMTKKHGQPHFLLFLLPTSASVVKNSVDVRSLQNLLRTIISAAQFIGCKPKSSNPCGEAWMGILLSESSVIYMKIHDLGLGENLDIKLCNPFFMREWDLSSEDFTGDQSSPSTLKNISHLIGGHIFENEAGHLPLHTADPIPNCNYAAHPLYISQYYMPTHDGESHSLLPLPPDYMQNQDKVHPPHITSDKIPIHYIDHPSLHILPGYMENRRRALSSPIDHTQNDSVSTHSLPSSPPGYMQPLLGLRKHTKKSLEYPRIVYMFCGAILGAASFVIIGAFFNFASRKSLLQTNPDFHPSIAAISEYLGYLYRMSLVRSDLEDSGKVESSVRPLRAAFSAGSNGKVDSSKGLFGETVPAGNDAQGDSSRSPLRTKLPDGNIDSSKHVLRRTYSAINCGEVDSSTRILWRILTDEYNVKFNSSKGLLKTTFPIGNKTDNVSSKGLLETTVPAGNSTEEDSSKGRLRTTLPAGSSDTVEPYTGPLTAGLLSKNSAKLDTSEGRFRITLPNSECEKVYSFKNQLKTTLPIRNSGSLEYSEDLFRTIFSTQKRVKVKSNSGLLRKILPTRNSAKVYRSNGLSRTTFPTKDSAKVSFKGLLRKILPTCQS